MSRAQRFAPLSLACASYSIAAAMRTVQGSMFFAIAIVQVATHVECGGRAKRRRRFSDAPGMRQEFSPHSDHELPTEAREPT